MHIISELKEKKFWYYFCTDIKYSVSHQQPACNFTVHIFWLYFWHSFHGNLMEKWDARNVVAADAHPSSLPNDKVSTSSCIQGSSISCYNVCMSCQAPAKIPFQANTKNTLVFDLFVLVILSSFNSLMLCFKLLVLCLHNLIFIMIVLKEEM